MLRMVPVGVEVNTNSEAEEAGHELGAERRQKFAKLIDRTPALLTEADGHLRVLVKVHVVQDGVQVVGCRALGTGLGGPRAPLSCLGIALDRSRGGLLTGSG